MGERPKTSNSLKRNIEGGHKQGRDQTVPHSEEGRKRPLSGGMHKVMTRNVN